MVRSNSLDTLSSELRAMAADAPCTILVAGDVCLDVLGVPVPPPSAAESIDNWRLTGETRTHYLPGGAMLLAALIKAAVPNAEVLDTRASRPPWLRSDAEADHQTLTPAEFVGIAERLTREDIVHSLLSLTYFREGREAKEANVLRVTSTFGFSGPRTGDPTLPMQPPHAMTSPDVIVLDDTGNRFRRAPELWPEQLTRVGSEQPIVVHKLHRPLPRADVSPNRLWQTVTERFQHRVVIVPVDDLRGDDALISRGLSWERTALDVVWQLLNRPTFAPLRTCPHLVIPLALDGAVYWQHREQDGKASEQAWLIYDPAGIEGSFAGSVDGQMVGYGSAFTAGLLQHLTEQRSADAVPLSSESLCTGIQKGLVAARRLLRLGYRTLENGELGYPSAELFGPLTKKDAEFACHLIPIIPQAAIPDRGYWRLLDTIFQGHPDLLHRAVSLRATGATPRCEEDQRAAALLKQVPLAVFAKALQTYDRREIENYRSLYALMLDYIGQRNPPRPLSVAVFGPPGAGKSFGIKMVAKALSSSAGARPIEALTFNLSQYQSPEQLSDAFHLVRDLVLRGKVPLVFFDEFDSTLAGVRLGWLRYFLAPMQDSEFLDRGTPHPIGQAIFVFAGGTCSTYAQFAEPFVNERSSRHVEFQAAKGPDFLSRLRGTLDVPGLDLNVPFDCFGPVEGLPCEAAILLRRAGIFNFQLGEKAPWLRNADKSLRVSPVVVRALLQLPHFEHGNRSFEALLDMSHLPGATTLTPALLPAPSHAGLHAAPLHFGQLLTTEYPFAESEREQIARAIHESYRRQRALQKNASSDDPSLRDWPDLPERLKQSNREQADHIAVKLRTAGLWFRKALPGALDVGDDAQRLAPFVELLARSEHDRWVAEKRRRGWIPGINTQRSSRNDELLIHNFLVPWDELSQEEKDLDREPVRQIPAFLAAAGYEVFKP